MTTDPKPPAPKERCRIPMNVADLDAGLCQRGKGHDGGHCLFDIDDKPGMRATGGAVTTPVEPGLARCGHVAYRGHDDACIEDGCQDAAYQVVAPTAPVETPPPATPPTPVDVVGILVGTTPGPVARLAALQRENAGLRDLEGRLRESGRAASELYAKAAHEAERLTVENAGLREKLEAAELVAARWEFEAAAVAAQLAELEHKYARLVSLSSDDARRLVSARDAAEAREAELRGLVERVLAGEEAEEDGCDAWDRWSKDARAWLRDHPVALPKETK